MAFIEFYKGCGASKYCMGPRYPYFTLFGTESIMLIFHFLIALFIGLILLSVLGHLKKKQKINLGSKLIIIIFIVAVLLLFILLAALFPIRAVY